jgi:hypothetical protein
LTGCRRPRSAATVDLAATDERSDRGKGLSTISAVDAADLS